MLETTKVGTTKMIKGYNNHTIASGSPAGSVIVSRNKALLRQDSQSRIENRCGGCNRVLFMGVAKRISIKCRRCGKINIFKENDYMKI